MGVPTTQKRLELAAQSLVEGAVTHIPHISSVLSRDFA
jgi:hypothetical protein